MNLTDMFGPMRYRDSKVLGVVIGIVKRNKDPDGLGRVTVTIPSFDDTQESNWAPVASFMAGKDRGAIFLPEVDDWVLVAFLHGDVNMPIVIGALHNGKDKGPYANEDGSNNIRVIQSRAGQILRFDDTKGAEKVEITDEDGTNTVTVDLANEKITLCTKGDVEIESDGDIKLTSKGDMSFESDGDVKIEAKGKFEVDSKDKVKIKGMELEAKADTKASIEANADVGVKSNANLSLRGSSITLN